MASQTVMSCAGDVPLNNRIEYLFGKTTLLYIQPDGKSTGRERFARIRYANRPTPWQLSILMLDTSFPYRVQGTALLRLNDILVNSNFYSYFSQLPGTSEIQVLLENAICQTDFFTVETTKRMLYCLKQYFQ